MNPQSNPLSRLNNVVVQELDGEVLIYDLLENRAFCLNETSALVWQACDGERNIPEISRFVSEKLNSPANEDLIWFALDQLKKEKLIETRDDFPLHFKGLSRREVIKKVGFGTMIALPIVASIVAPTSIMSQSTCGVCQCNMSGPNPGGNWNNGDLCGTTVPCPSLEGGCSICRSNGNSANPLGDFCFNNFL